MASAEIEQDETFRRKFHYYCGWSYVDFKRFGHFSGNETDGAAQSAQVSFLCPNRAHQDWLTTFLTKDLMWDSKKLKVIHGETFGGHSIVMVNMAGTFVEETLRAPFEQNLNLGEMDFLRGYLDHQVIAPKYHRPLSSNQQNGNRSTHRIRSHFQPYSTPRARGIRVSFSQKEHHTAVASFARKNGPSFFELQATSSSQTNETTDKVPLIWEHFDASPALYFLSWLARSDREGIPRFGHRYIITKLSKYVKQDGEPVRIATTTTTNNNIQNDETRSGYGFQLAFPVEKILVDPGVWGGPIFVTLESSVEAKDIPTATSQRVQLRVAPNTQNTELAEKFLRMSSVSASTGQQLNAIRLSLVYFGPIELVPTPKDLELVVDYQFQEWVIMS